MLKNGVHFLLVRLIAERGHKTFKLKKKSIQNNCQKRNYFIKKKLML